MMTAFSWYQNAMFFCHPKINNPSQTLATQEKNTSCQNWYMLIVDEGEKIRKKLYIWEVNKFLFSQVSSSQIRVPASTAVTVMLCQPAVSLSRILPRVMAPDTGSMWKICSWSVLRSIVNLSEKEKERTHQCKVRWHQIMSSPLGFYSTGIFYGLGRLKSRNSQLTFQQPSMAVEIIGCFFSETCKMWKPL